MNIAHRENVIFSLGQLQQKYYVSREQHITYRNMTGKEDVTALDNIITTLKLMIEYAEEIDWFMLHDYKSDLKQYQEVFDNLEDNPYKAPNYKLEIGDLSCNICGKDHNGDCK